MASASTAPSTEAEAGTAVAVVAVMVLRGDCLLPALLPPPPPPPALTAVTDATAMVGWIPGRGGW